MTKIGLTHEIPDSPFMRQAMIFARRLHDDKADIVPGQLALEAPDAVAIVGQPQAPAAGMEMDIEMVFTDVDADVDLVLRTSCFGLALALHAGLAPNHLFRTSAKGPADQAHPRFVAKGFTAPPVRRRAGGRPRSAGAYRLRFAPDRTCKGLRCRRYGWVTTPHPSRLTRFAPKARSPLPMGEGNRFHGCAGAGIGAGVPAASPAGRSRFEISV
jgi:hypothetical protein